MNDVTPRTRRPWLHGQWTEARGNEFPWPGYTIDTSTVLDLLRIAREDDPRAFVTTSTDMGNSTPVLDSEIDELPEYQLRRLRLVHPAVALGPDAVRITYHDSPEGDTIAKVAAHIAGAGRPRIHRRGLTARWPIPAAALVAATWTWAAVTNAASPAVLALLALLGALVLIQPLRDTRVRVASAAQGMPGVYVIPQTRREVRAARENRRRDVIAAALGFASAAAVAGLTALIFG